MLFVSHNMGAVRALCGKGLYLDGGLLRADDVVERCIDQYLNLRSGLKRVEVKFPPRETVRVQLLRLAVQDDHGRSSWELPHDRPFVVRVEMTVREPVTNVFLALHIHDQDLATILFSRDFETDVTRLGERKPGQYSYEIHVPGHLLVPGEYTLSVHVAESTPGRIVDAADHACSFVVIDNGSVQARMGFPWRGKVAVPLSWDSVEFVPHNGQSTRK